MNIIKEQVLKKYNKGEIIRVAFNDEEGTVFTFEKYKPTLLNNIFVQDQVAENVKELSELLGDYELLLAENNLVLVI